MKHFFANLVAMFFISKKLRRRIRSKIMGKKSPEQDAQRINERLKQNYFNLKNEWLTHNNGKALIPGRFNEYDLVLGIGATCHIATLLNHFNLRMFASPFDWTAGQPPKDWLSEPSVYRDTRFREKIQALCNNFKGWTEPNNFEPISQWRSPNVPHWLAVNTKTHIRYMHEFPIDQDIMQHMPDFLAKITRRIKHLYDAVDKSGKILIVWTSGIWDQVALLEKNIPNKDVIFAVNQIKKIYPNKSFDFVFFEHDGTLGRFEYKKTRIKENAFKIKTNHFLHDNEYNFVHPAPEWFPHLHVISEMLDNIKLSENAFKLPDKSADYGL